MKNFISTFLFIFVFTSCLEVADTTRQFDTAVENANQGGTGGNGNGAVNDDDSLGGDNEVVSKVEIRHLIEPSIDEDSTTGDYKRKLTIPKNYNGKLYIAGINISTLSSKKVFVKFNFGYNSAPKLMEATVASAPGLTNQSSVDVLVIDLRNRPFGDIQLVYDLFDYNDYDFSGGSSDPTVLSEPVTFNRDDKLFCRGLALKDDPTFTGQISTGCSSSDDVCKYAYAKILDQGLVYNNGSVDVPIIPSSTSVQSDSSVNSLYEDTETIKLSRCLPDNMTGESFNYRFDLSTVFTFNYTNPVGIAIGSETYYYKGPYRAIDSQGWDISSDAVTSTYGIFRNTINNDLNYGERSYLFPLYFKDSLPAGAQYLGSSTPDGSKTIQTMASSTDSLWMDGCGLRATSYNDITRENIGSCNVTASIEIITEDDEGKQTVVDTSKDVKLQLVTDSNINSSSDRVLSSEFRQCSSSNQCGSDSCCINGRCWSKTIVSQCIEDLPSYGNYETGASCSSDYECASLCCNEASGRCAPHDTISENPAYCSKASGNTCVAKEWCEKVPVLTCGIVQGPDDENGGKTCSKRCVTVEIYADCQSQSGGIGRCVSPTPAPPITFNPNDPNRCDDAISFDELEKCANDPENCTANVGS